MQANSGASSIRFRGTLRPLVNNSDDIGTSSRRFKDLYLSGTVNSNGLSALNSGSGDCSVQIKSTSAGDPKLIFDSAAANRSGVIQFRDQGANIGRIEYVNNGDRIDMRAGSATGITASVTNSAFLIGGTTSGASGATSFNTSGSAQINFNASSTGGQCLLLRRVNHNGNALTFENADEDEVGSITLSSNATAYNTS